MSCSGEVNSNEVMISHAINGTFQYYCVHKSLSLEPIMNYLNPLHILTVCFFILTSMHVPSILLPSVIPLKTHGVCVLFIHATRPTTSFMFDQWHNILGGVQLFKL